MRVRAMCVLMWLAVACGAFDMVLRMELGVFVICVCGVMSAASASL